MAKSLGNYPEALSFLGIGENESQTAFEKLRIRACP